MTSICSSQTCRAQTDQILHPTSNGDSSPHESIYIGTSYSLDLLHEWLIPRKFSKWSFRSMEFKSFNRLENCKRK